MVVQGDLMCLIVQENHAHILDVQNLRLSDIAQSMKPGIEGRMICGVDRLQNAGMAGTGSSLERGICVNIRYVRIRLEFTDSTLWRLMKLITLCHVAGAARITQIIYKHYVNLVTAGRRLWKMAGGGRGCKSLYSYVIYRAGSHADAAANKDKKGNCFVLGEIWLSEEGNRCQQR
jgi:hypothetical protein